LAGQAGSRWCLCNGNGVQLEQQQGGFGGAEEIFIYEAVAAGSFESWAGMELSAKGTVCRVKRGKAV